MTSFLNSSSSSLQVEKRRKKRKRRRWRGADLGNFPSTHSKSKQLIPRDGATKTSLQIPEVERKRLEEEEEEEEEEQEEGTR